MWNNLDIEALRKLYQEWSDNYFRNYFNSLYKARLFYFEEKMPIQVKDFSVETIETTFRDDSVLIHVTVKPIEFKLSDIVLNFNLSPQKEETLNSSTEEPKKEEVKKSDKAWDKWLL